MPVRRLIAFAAATVFATVAHTAEPSAVAAPSPRPAAPECPAPEEAVEPLPLGAGLRAFVDPETGRLRTPTADDLAAISATSRFSRNKSIEGLEVEYRADGSKFVDLQGRFMHTLRVTRNSDGGTSFTCTDREPHAHSHAVPPAAPQAPAEK